MTAVAWLAGVPAALVKAHGVIAWQAAASSVLAKAGIGHQVLKNWRRKSCDGMSGLFFWLCLLSYTLWTLDGATGGGWTLLWGQAPGAVLSLLVAGQAVWYGRRRRGWRAARRGASAAAVPVVAVRPPRA